MINIHLTMNTKILIMILPSFVCTEFFLSVLVRFLHSVFAFLYRFISFSLSPVLSRSVALDLKGKVAQAHKISGHRCVYAV